MVDVIISNSEHSQALQNRFRMISIICSLLVGIIGLAAIAGLIFDITLLKSVFPKFVVVKMNAAIVFVFTSLSLLIKQTNNNKSIYIALIANIFAGAVFLIGFLTLLEYALKLDLHIDQMFHQVSPSPYETYPLGRIAPVTTMIMMMISLSLFLYDSGRFIIVSQICALIIGLFGLLILTSASYHAVAGVQVISYAYAAVHSAFNFILISIAIIFSHPTVGLMSDISRDTLTAKAMRWIVPVAIILPIILGQIIMLGGKNGLYDIQSGLSYILMSIITIFLTYLFFKSKWMTNLELRTYKTIIDLEESNKELQQLTNVAAHDLQEPLRMISNYTMLLERRYKDKLDSDANDFIHFAVDGSKRMQELINDLLDYSRVNTRSKPFTQVDANHLLQNAINNLQSEIKEKNALISHDILPVINVDESQITQVFYNLISNSIKFCENKPEIKVSCREEGDKWIFSVSDNGIGISSEYYNKIFDIFQRLNPKDKYAGSGVGLAICKKIILRHGGHIWVDSILGKGSTFNFSIARGAI